MAVVWRSSVNRTGTSQTLPASGNFTLPSGTVAGDLLYLQVGYEKGTDCTLDDTPFSDPFTAVSAKVDQGANVGQRCYWKIATSTDVTNGHIGAQATFFSTSVKFSATLSRFDGHHATTPIRGRASASSASGNPDPPNITSIVSDDLLLAMAAAKSQTTYSAPPSGYVERYDNPNSADGTPSLVMADKTATGTSDDPSTFTPGGASEWVSETVAITPAAGGQAAPPRTDHQYRLRRV